MKVESLNSLKESDTVEERKFIIQKIFDQKEAIDVINRCEEIINTIRYKAIQQQMLKSLKI